MSLPTDLRREIQAAADHLDSFDRPLSADGFVAEIAAVKPASSDIH